MNCPFFKEQRVKYCGAAGYRKMILLDGADTGHERCSGPLHTECSVAGRTGAPQAALDGATAPVCPFLRQSLVQYCTAAAFQKFIPASEPSLLRCGRPAYRYCDLYRTTVSVDSFSPRPAVPPSSNLGLDGPEARSICAPSHLDFAPNHMWLDRTAPGCCQIGIDAFLAGVLGSVEQLTFLTVSGVCEPWVVLTVRGVDLHLEFPRRLKISAANLYLRAEPFRLISDPYGAGWLFEGSPAECLDPDVRLIPGSKAASWMREEHGRLNDYLNRQQQPRKNGHDAGLVWPPAALLEHLSREQMLSLFSEFFSTHEKRRR